MVEASIINLDSFPSEVVEKLRETEKNATTRANHISQLREKIETIVKKDELTAKDEDMLAAMQKELMIALSECDALTNKIQKLIGIENPRDSVESIQNDFRIPKINPVRQKQYVQTSPGRMPSHPSSYGRNDKNYGGINQGKLVRFGGVNPSQTIHNCPFQMSSNYNNRNMGPSMLSGPFVSPAQRYNNPQYATHISYYSSQSVGPGFNSFNPSQFPVMSPQQTWTGVYGATGKAHCPCPGPSVQWGFPTNGSRNTTPFGQQPPMMMGGANQMMRMNGGQQMLTGFHNGMAIPGGSQQPMAGVSPNVMPLGQTHGVTRAESENTSRFKPQSGLNRPQAETSNKITTYPSKTNSSGHWEDKLPKVIVCDPGKSNQIPQIIVCEPIRRDNNGLSLYHQFSGKP